MSCHVTSPSSPDDGRQRTDGLVPTNALCLVRCIQQKLDPDRPVHATMLPNKEILRLPRFLSVFKKTAGILFTGVVVVVVVVVLL